VPPSLDTDTPALAQSRMSGHLFNSPFHPSEETALLFNEVKDVIFKGIKRLHP